jgi:Crinkler effector protein N-terminal domain
MNKRPKRRQTTSLGLFVSFVPSHFIILLLKNFLDVNQNSTLTEDIKVKKRPELDHITTDSLVLWPFSVPYNENLKENFERLNLDYDKSLKPLIVSQAFFSSELGKASVHIIVDRLYPGEFSYATRMIKSSYTFNGSSDNAIQTTAPRTQLLGAWRPP